MAAGVGEPDRGVVRQDRDGHRRRRQLQSGALYGWHSGRLGLNYTGQLGNDTTTTRTTAGGGEPERRARRQNRHGHRLPAAITTSCCAPTARSPPGEATATASWADGTTTNRSAPVLVNRSGVLAGENGHCDRLRAVAQPGQVLGWLPRVLGLQCQRPVGQRFHRLSKHRAGVGQHQRLAQWRAAHDGRRRERA